MTEKIPALIAAYRGIRDWQERVAPSASADEMEDLKPHVNALGRVIESLSAPPAFGSGDNVAVPPKGTQSAPPASDDEREALIEALQSSPTHLWDTAVEIGDVRGIAEVILAAGFRRSPVPPEGAHWECDCVPDLGPSHCHACSDAAGSEVSWAESTHAPVPPKVDESSLQRGYQAVHDSGVLTNDAQRNAITWRAVDAALRAALAAVPPVTEEGSR